MKKKFISILALGIASQTLAAMNDDPILSKVMIDQFEVRVTDGSDPLVFEGDLWIGKDLNKAWFTLDTERVGSKTEKLEFQALYSSAVTTYWDVQAGWRHDDRPSNEKRDWLALGWRGLSPYYFEVNAFLLASVDGGLGLDLNAEYEILLTQSWVLSPGLTINAYSRSDEVIGQGYGLSDAELGLRLHYAIRREFAPYIGVNWERKFGETAKFAREEGEETSDFQVVAGIRAWF